VQNGPMLGRLGIWRHVIVGVLIALCSGSAAIGLVGGRGEQFDVKQVTVSPAGDGVRIREVVDQDFGNSPFGKHGYERIIPTDFGTPEDIDASSPDANADINREFVTEGYRIRLGDPDTTFSGQHRYILSYTLPSAGLQSGILNLDIIDAGEDLRTEHFEVILTGFVLEQTECNVGGEADEGGCTLQRTGNDYRVVFEPLDDGDGVNVRGVITEFTTPTEPPLPDLPERAPDRRAQLALAMIPIGLVGPLAVYVIARRRGRNEVYAGGAADAAYGRLPGPGMAGTAAPVATRLVSDAQMERLTTIEFVPPKGVDPWQGQVLLKERITDDTVTAWLSALAAGDAITLRDDNGTLVMGSGQRRDQLDPATAALVDRFMSGQTELRLGKYDPSFASAWSDVKRQQRAAIAASGWWKRRPPGGGAGSPASGILTLLVLGAVVLFYLGGTVASATLGFVHGVPAALVFGFVIPTLAAYCVYATMLPARSAAGSALSLLTESFRRFLVASEGRHVEWAWKQGLLREYSAWAVALGAADAWGKALADSNVPAPELGYSNPLLAYSMAHSFSSSHTAPSSSGSGGGGGGGGVGGGGGGGSSGSW
jgi:uncharacterized membrane protein YgcG